MHPAPSVIAFTALSGAGFGLLFWLGLGLPSVTGWTAFWWFALAFALSAGGLTASTFHLGHPERALKAFTQWRSSWLSREACVSVAALSLMGLYAFGSVFLAANWAAIGVIGAALSLATVFTTSMIYAQLKTVPRWNHPLVPPMFLTFSLAGGALLAAQPLIALPLLALLGVMMLGYWIVGDGRLAASGTTLATATQLGDGGSVRAFEPPHTGTNYLLHEMVYHVGRKRSVQLRAVALVLGAGLPILILMISHGALAIGLAALAHLLGVLASRWLFFAEAEHVVGLYYGQR